MEYPSSWSVDSKKHQTEKAFCCLNARARDFAKLGRLFLNDGNWNGQQIVSKKWVDETTNFTEKGYHYQWWREPSKKYDDFYAQGILGQYVYVNRDTNTIIVRLGKKYGSVYWERLFRVIASKV